MTTILDQVRALIGRLAPDAICDDCIAEKLRLPVGKDAARLTHELTGAEAFERSRAVCSICAATKLVTSRRAR